MKQIAKKDCWFLTDTRHGFRMDLIDKSLRRYRLRITEGWEGLIMDKKLCGRRLILQGSPAIITKIKKQFSFLLFDDKWRNVIKYWYSMRALIEYLVFFFSKDFKILQVKRI